MVFTTLGVGSISAACAGIYYSLRDYTIKGFLASSGKEAIDGNVQLTVAFNEFKDDEEFMNTIFKEGEIKSKDLDKGPAHLKKWCDSVLFKKLSEPKDLIDKAIKYCSKPPLTIAEKIKIGSKGLVSDWSKRVTSLKTSLPNEQLLKDLKEINQSITDFEQSSQTKDIENALKNDVRILKELN